MEGDSGLKEKDLPIDYDLIIIGYGMVGAVAALLALKYKLKVAVLEIRKIDDLYVPKAGRIDAETMRIFEQLGFSRNDFNALYGSKILDSKGRDLVQVAHEQLNGFAPMYSIYQPDLQLELHRKIAVLKDKIGIYEKHRAEAIELKKDRVKIIAHNLETDHFFELSGRFLLACNGQESLVPAQCDFNYRLLDYTQFNLNVETQSLEPQSFNQLAVTYFDGQYPLSCISDSALHQRWEFRLDPDTMAMPDVYELIRKELDKKIKGDFEILHSYVYQFETRILDKWQRKRIFITGDAAHIMPPYLGMGLSAGIKDVYNLIWKIALVADRRVKGPVLDSYQPEREEEAKHLLDLNLTLQKLFDKGKLGFIDRILSFFKIGIIRKIRLESKYSKGIIGTKHKLSGKSFPPFSYLRNAKALTEVQLLSGDFVIAAYNCDPVDALNPKNIEYLAQLNARFLRFDSKPKDDNKRFTKSFSFADSLGTAWFKKHKINYILIRPDRIIFDALKDEKQLNKAVAGLSKTIEIRKRDKRDNA
jgi:3-(3-hydroxy-phenyl)propionate hydroxylase